MQQMSTALHSISSKMSMHLMDTSSKRSKTKHHRLNEGGFSALVPLVTQDVP